MVDSGNQDASRAAEGGEARPSGQNSVTTSEILAAIQQQREGMQRDLNAIKSGFDRSLYALEQRFETRLGQTQRGTQPEDLLSLLRNPNLDEGERMRLQVRLLEQQRDEALKKAADEAEKARYTRETFLIREQMSRTLGELGLTGREEGIPLQSEPGESPLEFHHRWQNAAFDAARARNDKRSREAASRVPAPAPAAESAPATVPRFDAAAPRGAPVGSDIERLTSGTAEDRRARAKRIDRAGLDGQRPIPIEEASRL